MYRTKLWDEDKWDIHSGSYTSSKRDDITYHEKEYGIMEKNTSSDYMKREENRERDEKENDLIFNELEEEKNEKQSIEEDSLPFKAASQIIEENKNTQKFDKRIFASIEEAIKKAVEEEKKVIIMNN